MRYRENDEWQIARRYFNTECLAKLSALPISDALPKLLSPG